VCIWRREGAREQARELRGGGRVRGRGGFARERRIDGKAAGRAGGVRVERRIDLVL
jgi:hypothetical protein